MTPEQKETLRTAMGFLKAIDELANSLKPANPNLAFELATIGSHLFFAMGNINSVLEQPPTPAPLEP